MALGFQYILIFVQRLELETCLPSSFMSMVGNNAQDLMMFTKCFNFLPLQKSTCWTSNKNDSNGVHLSPLVLVLSALSMSLYQYSSLFSWLCNCIVYLEGSLSTASAGGKKQKTRDSGLGFCFSKLNCVCICWLVLLHMWGKNICLVK